MSNTTSIVCSGYNRLRNEIIFISKNNDSEDKNDYHFNLYNNASQAKLTSLPLSSIDGFPDPKKFSFGGLCAYASSNSSIYLNFDSVPASNNSNLLTANGITLNTTITALQLLDNTKQKFQTVLQLPNTKLSSLVYVADSNKSANLAYIATSTSNNQMSLNLVNLNAPNLYYASRNISEAGILASGGPDSQSLYFIQDSAIDEYRLDTKQYSQSVIHTNLNSEGLIKATTGQVIIYKNQTAYISIYHPENGNIDILNHNLAISNYTTLPLQSSGYISLVLSNLTTVISDSGNTARPPSQNIPPVSRNKSTSTTSNYDTTTIAPTATPSDSPTNFDEGKFRNVIQKREVEAVNGNSQASSDGAYNYHRFRIVDSSYPQAAVLVPSANDSQSPPYDFALIYYNDAQGFTVATENGNLSSGTPFVSGDQSASPGHLSGGAIAGIVIGVVAFIAIIGGLLFYARKRKDKKHSYGTREMVPRSGPVLSTEPEDFLAPYIDSPKEKNGDNHSHTSSILQEATSIPEEYHDGSRPDIRPLSYNGDAVDYAHLSPEELLQLEPDVNGPLFLFSGLYTSSADERVTYLEDGYAVRTFEAGDGTKHTVHYFSAAHLDTFVRSVFTVLRISKTKDAKDKAQIYAIKSERAIVLSSPTPHFRYQYIWITSPVIPEHSLHHLLCEKNRWSFIDYNNMDYKIWSIYAILKNLEALHSHKFVHLAIDLRAFYFDHELKATDWRLANFECARSLKQRGTTRNRRVLPPNSSFTPPEIIHEQGEITQLNIDEQKLDIWSLGCVIYTVATGGLLLFEDEILVKNLITFNDDMRQHVRIAIRDNVENAIFQTLLEKMLQVHSSDRKCIKELLDYWNSIYNMEE